MFLVIDKAEGMTYVQTPIRHVEGDVALLVGVIFFFGVIGVLPQLFR